MEKSRTPDLDAEGGLYFSLPCPDLHGTNPVVVHLPIEIGWNLYRLRISKHSTALINAMPLSGEEMASRETSGRERYATNSRL